MLFNRVFKYEPPTVKIVGYKVDIENPFTGGNWSIDLTNMTTWNGVSGVSPSPGDLVIAYTTFVTNANTNFNSPMLSSGWTLMNSAFVSSSIGTGTSVAFYYKVMGNTPDTQINFGGYGVPSGTPPYPSNYGAAFVFSNAVFDGHTLATGTIEPLTPSSVTPTAPRSFIMMLSGGNSSNLGFPTNMTDYKNIFSVGNFTPSPPVLLIGRAGYFDSWTSGSYTPGTWGTSPSVSGRTWVSATIVLKPPF